MTVNNGKKDVFTVYIDTEDNFSSIVPKGNIDSTSEEIMFEISEAYDLPIQNL